MTKIVRFRQRKTIELKSVRPSGKHLAMLAAGLAFTSWIALSVAPPLWGCAIKGNIAAGGDRIYHLPGQLYYMDTNVNVIRGDRWFCTEDAARRAGWRKAKV